MPADVISNQDAARIKVSSNNKSTTVFKDEDTKKKSSIWGRTESGTVSSEFTKTYTSYSGHDMVAVFEIPLLNGSIVYTVGELQTISYSMYNEKMPVRVLGDMNMKSIVFGNRTIAGSMVFTVFDRHWAHKMMDKYLSAVGSNAHILTDELPPINITISMCNEYGAKSRLGLYGVTFVSEGQTMSIQDMYTENTFEYMAKDIDYLTNIVDANASSKDRSLAAEYAGELKKNIESINTPIDIPEKAEPAQEQAATKKADIKLEIDFSKEDLSAGRSHCISKADESYVEKQKEVEKLYFGGFMTKNEYTQTKANIKRDWQNIRQHVNEIFSKQ